MKCSSYLFVQRLGLYTCGMMFVTSLLVGCTSSTAQGETYTVTTTTIAETITPLLPTITATVVTPTITLAPTHVLLPAPTHTPFLQTLIPTQLPTLTPAPTLTEQQEGLLIQELMATNGGCQLPCWWGLKLGDTMSSVGETFASWGATPWHVTTSGDEVGYINLGYNEPNSSVDPVHIFLQFYAIEGTVQYIKVSGSHESRQFGEQEFIRDWEKYFLSATLQKYGIPSLVYLRPGNRLETGPSNYTLLLYYPDLGINVSYNFLGTYLGNGIDEICFVLENVFLIQLYLYNPEFAESWPIPQLLGLGSEDDIWLIESLLEMDRATFYETYQDPNNAGADCVRVSR